MNWKELFEESILDRGYKYLLDGKIDGIIEKNDIFYGKVDGVKRYDSTVSLSNNKVSLNCSCPFFSKKNCKHLAAVMFKLELDDFIEINKAADMLFLVRSIYLEKEEIISFLHKHQRSESMYYQVLENMLEITMSDIEDVLETKLNLIELEASTSVSKFFSEDYWYLNRIIQMEEQS